MTESTESWKFVCCVMLHMGDSVTARQSDRALKVGSLYDGENGSKIIKCAPNYTNTMGAAAYSPLIHHALALLVSGSNGI